MTNETRLMLCLVLVISLTVATLAATARRDSVRITGFLLAAAFIWGTLLTVLPGVVAEG